MSLFPDTIKADLAGSRVDMELLVLFDFATEPVRVWLNGTGQLRTNDDYVWDGLGRIGSISGIEQAINGEAPEVIFTLSGVDSQLVRLARDEFETECKGRLITVLMQFFGTDDPADPDNQRPLDLPYPIASARALTPELTYGEQDERSITIRCESLFSLRSRPRAALCTDADQQRRFPGDLGFSFVASLKNKVITWPDY